MERDIRNGGIEFLHYKRITYWNTIYYERYTFPNYWHSRRPPRTADINRILSNSIPDVYAVNTLQLKWLSEAYKIRKIPYWKCDRCRLYCYKVAFILLLQVWCLEVPSRRTRYGHQLVSHNVCTARRYRNSLYSKVYFLNSHRQIDAVTFLTCHIQLAN